MKNWKICFKIVEACSYLDLSTEEICSHLQNLGYTAVEWITESLNPYGISMRDLKKLLV